MATQIISNLRAIGYQPEKWNTSTSGCLQDITDFSRDMEGLMFGVVSIATEGAFVLSWPSDFKLCNKFVESLLSEPQDDIPNLLVEFMFGYVENTYFSKAWWDSLDKSMQDRIASLASTPVQYGHFINYSRMKFVNWGNYRHSNLCLDLY